MIRRLVTSLALLAAACAGGAPPPADAPTPPRVDETTRRLLGLKTARVVRGPLARHLRTVGEIEVGEDQVSVVNLRFSGWVERVHADRTGDEVRRGQTLFEIYSPELVAAQEELLLTARSAGPDSLQATRASRRLELMGVDPRDIGRILDADEVMRTVPIRAPRGGFVLHKDVVEGARVEEGHDLYRIGNLTTIWVTADVYAFDAPWVELGQPAHMVLPFHGTAPLAGRVSYIYPTLDATGRTLTVRLEFDNPGLRLRPGMLATVTIQVRRRDDVLVVPTEALLHAGDQEFVFVADETGAFRRREIRTGLSDARHLTEVVAGLEEGDEIVVSGHHLLQAAWPPVPAPSDADPPGHPADDGDHGYACPLHPGERSAEPGRCPRCGLFLEPTADDAGPAEDGG